MITFVIILTIILCGLAYYLNHEKLKIHNFLTITAICLGFIGAYYLILVNSDNTKKEYLTYHITKATYYEAWNEYIHKTCTRTYRIGKTTYTTTYDCSYVKNHPDKYIVTLNDGSTRSISREYYFKLRTLFNNNTFEELNRNFYTRDGDAYYSVFNNFYISYVEDEEYKNIFTKDNDLYIFEQIDTNEVKDYKLFDYPKITDENKQPNVLGNNTIYGKQLNRKLEIFNSKYGSLKQVRLFVLFYEGKSNIAAIKQKNYWRNGNKNEIVICIGTENNKVKWVDGFSWADDYTPIANIKQDILKYVGKELPPSISYSFEINILKHFKRKSFKDFDYISVEHLTNTHTIIMLITICVIIFIGYFLFIQHNETFNGFDYNKYRGY